MVADGSGLRIEPLATESLEERDGRLLIPESGITLGDDDVRELRDAGQR